jgi:hypothetical protein
MRLRRVSDQARVEGKRALHRALDGVRGHGAQRPVSRRARNEIEPIVAENSDAPDEATKALNRIADTIERVSVQLDAHQQERAEHFDAIEFLLREVVIGTALPSMSRPSVNAGVVDADAIEHIRADIDLSGRSYALEVETSVEVRSRFHDRWICGFTISEVVGGPERFRYRLTRRSDGIPLPILFDECDVRASTDSYDKQHTPS